MLRFLPPVSAMLAACAPPSQELSVPSPDPTAAMLHTSGASGAGPTAQAVHQAAQEPIREAVSAAKKPYPGTAANSDAAAIGRRIVSMAFVRLGPQEHLAVDLRDGRTVTMCSMGPEKFCGVVVAGEAGSKRHCTKYAEVVTARPSAAPIRDPHPLPSASRTGR